MKPFPTSTETELMYDMDRYINHMSASGKTIDELTLTRKQYDVWRRLCRRQQEHVEKRTCREVDGFAGTYRRVPVSGPGKRRYTKRDLGRLFDETGSAEATP